MGQTNAAPAADTQATETELRRLRKIAKERMVEQFGDVIRERGSLVVDCGAATGYALGYALITGDGYAYEVKWLAQEQVRTLAGRIG